MLFEKSGCMLLTWGNSTYCKKKDKSLLHCDQWCVSKTKSQKQPTALFPEEVLTSLRWMWNSTALRSLDKNPGNETKPKMITRKSGVCGLGRGEGLTNNVLELSLLKVFLLLSKRKLDFAFITRKHICSFDLYIDNDRKKRFQSRGTV